MDSSARKKFERGRRWTEEQKESAFVRWSDWYRRGLSIRQIAEESGRSYGFVHGVLSEGGVTLRSRGSVPGSTRK